MSLLPFSNAPSSAQKLYRGPGSNIVGNNQRIVQSGQLGAVSGQLSYSASGNQVSDTVIPVNTNLYSIRATNENAAARYLWVFNAPIVTPAAPVVGVFPIAAGSATAPASVTLGDDVMGKNGVYLSAGLSYGFSTSKAAYTTTGIVAADHTLFMIYLG
ncbi:hypothetical protein ACYOEI_10165 [Singulisphaera rosea]